MDIKPCPFCGGEKITLMDGSTFRWVHMECKECGARSGETRRARVSADDYTELPEKTLADAIEIWNERA